MHTFSYMEFPYSIADFNFNKKPLWTKEAAQAALDAADSDYRWGYAAPAPSDPYWRTYLDRHWGKKEVFDASIEGSVPYRRERLPKGSEMYVVPDLPPKRLDTLVPKSRGLSASSPNLIEDYLKGVENSNTRAGVWKAEKRRDIRHKFIQRNSPFLDIGAGKDNVPDPAITESKEKLWEKVQSIPDNSSPPSQPSQISKPVRPPATVTKTISTPPIPQISASPSVPTPSPKPSLLNRRNLMIGGGLIGLAGVGTATAMYLNNKYRNQSPSYDD